jgi:hypothetical protein
LKIGDRIELLAPMTNPDSKIIPVEEGMPAGLKGTIVYLSLEGPAEWHQIGVKWDNGRTLNILPGVDKFVVCKPQELTNVAE